MERNKSIALLFLILLILAFISLSILLQDVKKDFQEEELVKEVYNCSETLKYAYYNHTTKEVTYKESKHNVCNKIISK